MTSDERRDRINRAMSSDYSTGTRRTSSSIRGGSSSRSRSSYSSGRSASARRRRRRRRGGINWGQVIVAILISALIIFGAILLLKKFVGTGGGEKPEETTEAVVETSEEEVTETEPETTEPAREAVEVLEKARLLAAQYDYDGALELIDREPSIKELDSVREFIASVEETKSTLVKQDVTKITHVFFHILMVDTDNALSIDRWGEKQAGGYNSLMTTIPEFERILQAMYDKGFVLVSLHDMGHMEKQDDGTEKMVKGEIMLPPGKQAFVMSEDDVCYYEYMVGAGFADKMIIGEDGRPTTHYTDKDGNESVGDYDLVPLLDKFIDEHPDFSYHGHKACLVFTGYNGVLGYRTDETYLPENYKEHKVEGGHDVEAERAEAVKVLKALYDDGYDLGSHSWGHRDMGGMSFENLKIDSDKWEKNVNSLIREATGQGADILIYPKGADIGDWRGYNSSDQKKEGCLQKFNYLYDLGFRYYCNVDSTQYWVQVGDTYIRTGRRALDGYNFWYEIENNKGRFTDLWDDTSKIFDYKRWTPVPAY
ncbi:MAG: polysaccharide deacetylase family protein [Lachnospiraceae bacterium]|nr:polysaccharide deacetylase family protein [Lachnospiraceae bacterium]